MKGRTVDQERRKAIVWLIAAVVVLAAMLGMWWLVAETNEEGTHDAELLPIFTLIPLTISGYHLLLSRRRHGAHGPGLTQLGR